MKTEVVFGGRGKGKTAHLIKHAAESGAYIVCSSQEIARRLQQRAQQMGLTIRFPITMDEFAGGHFHPPGCKGFLIDNTLELIQGLAKGVPVLAISMDEDSMDQTWLPTKTPA